MPEEINRIVTDHVSDLLFCPTKTAQENLEKENITQGVFISGDVMADALEFYKNKLIDKESLLNKYALKEKDFLLLTLHRQGNTDSRENLKEIIAGLKEIPETILFPIHPRTKKMLRAFQLELPGNVKVIPPLEYTKMLILEQTASTILTDSGGIQKEAYLMGTPCITLRDETEWVETVQVGWNTLVGANRGKIVLAYNSFHPNGKRPPLFGNFHAAEFIAEKTVEWMKDNG
jgi:UDP-N-acetylglucosamine 2-epimerase